ncbi:NAD(P)H-dependent glycerol-3-phosphate dehydrogenase [Fodinicurvata sediminis]|uniref:NAD(P)H-dependent glycerol-3-phosphate dehydrogenase n=1 Tax=Fodinicurvata sediminis TaxID=1121832 RepID=UPI0003B45452|nr:NAD(P)H-dependent glycerol-3-phosphate dehydrogenase [Fodinicurvata sediminis]
MLHNIAVLGAGAWGTALAQIAALAQITARDGGQVTLWARDAELAETINSRQENPRHLPGIALNATVRASSDLDACLDSAQAVLLAIPAQGLRDLCTALAGRLPADCPLVICAKGIERDSGKLPSQVVEETLPGQPLAVLSGPSFAEEAARGLPTAVTLACRDRLTGSRLAGALAGGAFRPYLSDDPRGAEIGGALKNVVAIACGIVEGRDLGQNARAGLITRGLAEMARLGTQLEARRDSFMGLSGLGDLTLTCTSRASRNYSLGHALGRGDSLDQALAASRGVTEGIYTAQAASLLSRRLGVELPIAGAVDAVVNRGADLEQTIQAMLARPLKKETA